MNEINAATKVCGLIGNPVAHSISPIIHNSLSQIVGLNLAYMAFCVEKGKVKEAVDGAFALGIQGLNVTVPHKQEVIETLEDIDPLAQAIGAVNTLVRTENGFKGYNTDILGLEKELAEADIELKGKSIILLGAGGAARAIAFLCADKGAQHIWILNRTKSKADEIANDVNQHFHTECAKGLQMDEYSLLSGDDYIAIQTTSVGLHPNDDCAVIEDPQFYQKLAVGVDIIYTPVETKFMRLVKQQGKPAYNGLKMLLYQGIAAYELWNQVVVTDEMADKVYHRMEKELGIES